jgi:hypothetical protein
MQWSYLSGFAVAVFVGAVLLISCDSGAEAESPVEVPPPRDAGVYVGAALTPESGTATLPSALVWMSNNAADKGTYTIVMDGNASIPSSMLSYSDKTVHLSLEGETSTRSVQLTGTGSLFTVGKNVTLKLGNRVKLQGVADNTAALVHVAAGGKLEVGDGAVITGNKNTSGASGGGITAGASAVCIISGGEISGNESLGGAGVYVDGISARFEMSNGVVSGNRSTNGGAGVFIRGSAVGLISGGEILANIASGSATNAAGAGLRVTMQASVTMTGGTISGNKVQNLNAGGGGGVFIGNTNTRFVFQGGSIANNETTATGSASANNLYRIDGVFVNESGQTLNQAGGFVY